MLGRVSWIRRRLLILLSRSNNALLIHVALGLGPLEIAVLQRSKVQTARSLACHAPPNGTTLLHAFCTEDASYRIPWLHAEDAAKMPSPFSGWDTAASTPQECAIGWPAGVEMLLKAGSNGFFALGRAVALSDLECLELLLRSGCPLFDIPERRLYESYMKRHDVQCLWYGCKSRTCYEHEFVKGRFDEFWRSEDPGLVRCIVDALRERRVELGRLTELHLTFEERA